jgi:farnesyl diphosphate synthase
LGVECSLCSRHRKIVIYKTAYYSFYLPVALAMLAHGIPAPSGADLTLPLSAPPPTPASVTNTTDPYALALAILIPLGEYFQVQDDVLDFSGTPEQIGKVGTDIVDNKCSWPVNTALALATPAQRALLDANYGRKDPQAEVRVKELYKELGILERYEAYEEEAVGRIRALIDTIPAQGRPDGLKRAVFTDFVDKIYKRTK